MSELLLSTLAIVLGLALIGGLLHLANRVVHRWRNSHPGLFYDLCRLHGLNAGSRRLLRHVAQHHRLAQPARLFTEPQWLDPARLGGPLRLRSAEVSALRSRLFDGPPAGGE